MRGQISLEFSILLLAMIVVVLITTITPGLYGFREVVKTSHASLGHGSLSKLRTNIEMLSVSDTGCTQVVYIRSPPATWSIDGRNITLSGNGFRISTTCSIDLVSNNNPYRVGELRVIRVNLRKVNDTTVSIEWE